MELNPGGIFAVAGVGALLFALTGARIGSLWWVWAVWGALAGLTIGVICVGLAHSVALPYWTPQVKHKYVAGAVAAVVLMVVIAGGILLAHLRGKRGQV